MKPPPYILVGSARSGSTALARVLDRSKTGRCLIEPSPGLQRECRLAADGLMDRAAISAAVRSQVVPRLLPPDDDCVHGEKNVTYGAFLREIHDQTGCRIVFLHRDGRDVVRSLMDWHTGRFGNIYREACSSETMSNEALAASAGLPVHLDDSDHSRPRPRPGSRWHDEWLGMPRYEMAAWYWNECNKVHLEELRGVPASHQRHVDLAAGVDPILDLYEFLGIESPGAEVVRSMMDSRINSLADRDATSPSPHPDWRDWDSGRRDRFEAIAGESMSALGYWSDQRSRWRPADFGSTWQDRENLVEWYEWMYQSRRPQHDRLLSFLSARPEIETIVDIGCGIGVGYHDALADRRYVGLDLSHSNIDWCRANRGNPRHAWKCVDHAIEDPAADERGDLVFSQGTIDNAWDVDEFLAGMVRWSRGLIHATCYRGWFPDLEHHRYTWNAEHGCFYNDISPHRVRTTLERLGCTDIEIVPVEGKGLPCRETMITARVRTGETGE